MAIINSYPLATPKVTDLVLGTSTSSTGQTSTKSFTVQSIKDTTAGVQTIVSSTLDTLTISGSGTSAVTIGTLTAAVTDGGTALTTGNDVYDFVVGKITGTANTVPIWTGTTPSTTLGNSLISQANNSVIINGSGTDGRIQLNCSVTTHGVGIQSPPHSANATYTLILPTVSNPGAGKVLTSGAGTTNQLSWTDNGNVGGTGTQNKLPKWTDTTILGDSIMTEATDTISIAGNLSLQEIEVNETFKDGAGLVGGAGQLLSSTGTATSWVTPAPTGVASLSTTNTNLITITSPGSTPHTGAVVATPNISGGVSSSSQTLATGAEIQTAINTALAGTLTFKGTFNASTGAITSGSNSGSQLYTGTSGVVAITKGDFYIADTAGSFYGSVSMNVGDEAIALNTVSAAPPGSSVSDFSVVPSAGGGVTDVSSANTAITVSPSTGSVVLTSTVFSGGSTIGHVPSAAAASAGQYLNYQGNWTTLPSGDTYDLNATTDGTNVDINLTSGSGTDNSTVQLTAGTGMTITQSGGNNITLAAAGGGGTKTVSTVASVAAGVSTHALGISVTTTPLVNYVDLYISGVYQSKTSYTVSGSTLTLTGATFPTGALIETVTTT